MKHDIAIEQGLPNVDDRVIEPVRESNIAGAIGESVKINL